MDFLNGSRKVPLLRSLLPCVGPNERRLLTFLILIEQIRELMETIDDLQSGILDAMPAPEQMGEEALFHALESVCTKEELQSISQYKQMFQAMQMMQAAQQAESCQEEHSHHDSCEHREFNSSTDSKSPADFFRDMLSPEQLRMVDAIMEQNGGK